MTVAIGNDLFVEAATLTAASIAQPTMPTITDTNNALGGGAGATYTVVERVNGASGTATGWRLKRAT